MEFEIGQIFSGIYPPQAAEWCNERGDCFIEEIETTDGVRRFEIKPVSEDMLKQVEIAEIKSKLNDLDLKSIRALRAGESEYLEIYETQAQELRTRLSELE